ncbi:MAG: hypothetical protein V7K89_01465 [Nostoc sp.]|uniref:hypothetical protein n=1 Tax=Nostoc sp. TaxID=1180 RepID=UPI002FFD2D2E
MKLDGTRGSVTVSMPDFYRFTNIRLKVGILHKVRVVVTLWGGRRDTDTVGEFI